MLSMMGDDEEESTDDRPGAAFCKSLLVSGSPLISQSKWGGRPRGPHLFSKSQQPRRQQEALLAANETCGSPPAGWTWMLWPLRASGLMGAHWDLNILSPSR